MKTNLELVQGQLEAYNNFELEKFCSFYHSQVIIKDFFSEATIVSGIENFKLLYQKVFHTYPSQKCLINNRIVDELAIIDEEIILGRPDFPEGKKFTVIYAFRENLIDRVWFI